MQKKVIIIGASGHGKVIADIIKNSSDSVVGFLDDNPDIQGNVIFDTKKVLGVIDEQEIAKYHDCYFIIGIGNNKVRKTISKRFPKLKWYTAIHPKAVIADGVDIGEGTAIMAGAVVNTGTKIGKHCIINTCSSVDHDNMLEDYVLSDVFCSTEPNSKKNENPLKEKNKENNNIENENYFDKLYKEFKNSNLKKTIIIDNNGNNNLNIPKKCLFQDNNNNKNTIIRNPINLKAKQKHLSTKLLLTYNNMNKNNVLNKLKNNVKISNLNDDFRNILYNNLLSTKEIIPKDFLEINNGKNKKEKEEQKVPENNSIFEDYTNKSIDSSFLGSSLDEVFYNDLAGKKV